MATSSPPTRSPASDPRPSAWAALGLTSPFTVEEVHRAFREAAKSAHPDAGGDPRRFIELQRAYEIALDDAAARSDSKSSRSPVAPSRPVAPFVMVRLPRRRAAPKLFRALVELFAVAAFILAIFWATSMQREDNLPPRLTDEDGTWHGNAPHPSEDDTRQNDRDLAQHVPTSSTIEHDRLRPAAGELAAVVQARLLATNLLSSQDEPPDASMRGAAPPDAGPRALALDDAQADLERALREVSRASRLMYADSRLDLSEDLFVDDPGALSSLAGGRSEAGSQRTRTSATLPALRQQNSSSVFLAKRIPSSRSTHPSFSEVKNRLNNSTKRRWFGEILGPIGLYRFREETGVIRTSGRPDLRFWGYDMRSPGDYLRTRDYPRDGRVGIFSTLERLRDSALPQTGQRPSSPRPGVPTLPAWRVTFPLYDIPTPPALPGRDLDAWLPEFPD